MSNVKSLARPNRQLSASRGVVFAVPALLSLAVSCTSGSQDGPATSSPLIFNPTDDRQDPFALGFEPRYHTESDVLVVPASLVTDQGNGTSLLTTAGYGASNSLCWGEPFFSQPVVSGSCSGVLVAPDVIATSPNCLSPARKVVFHYRMDSATAARTSIPNQDIFTPIATLDSQNFPEGDWALVLLDRVVDHRRIAPLRRSGTIADNQTLFSIGHPSGLPYKYVNNGQVVSNTGTLTFQHSLDTFLQSEGAMLVNPTTREVEGIQSAPAAPGAPGTGGSGTGEGPLNDFVPNPGGSYGGSGGGGTGGSGSTGTGGAAPCKITRKVCAGTSSPCETVEGTRATAFSDRLAAGLVQGTSSTYFAQVDNGTPARADLIAVKWDGVKVHTSSGSAFGASSSWTSAGVYGLLGTYFADVTGDGKADAIVVGDSARITVRRANSTGTGFSSTAEQWAATGNFAGERGQYFADVNFDSKVDLIMVNNNSIVVRRANSGGTAFSTTEETWSNVAYFGRFGTYFADVTGDHKADAIAVGDDGIKVRRANTSLNVFDAAEAWTPDLYFGGLGTYFADVTGDGKADAIAVNGAGVIVRRANATSTAFGPTEPWLPTPYYGEYGTYFADVTGDGKADAILVNAANVVLRRANSGGTAFSGTLEFWLNPGDFGTVGAVWSSLR
jgi:hypothetical protein